MNKLSLLQHLVSNVESVQLPMGTITKDQLDSLPFVKAKLSTKGNIVGIRKEGGKALYNLTSAVFDSSPRYQRGITSQQLFDTITDIIIIDFFGKNAAEINLTSVAELEDKIASWFDGKITSHRLYIPCAISPWRSPPFAIGPIAFSHLDDFSGGEGRGNGKFIDGLFSRTFETMGREAALWMATVDIADCIDSRALELGAVAVDVALAGLQLVVPLDFSQNITRMAARTPPRFRETISRKNGGFTHSSENLEPGLSMGEGVLAKFVTAGSSILKAVGNRVESYIGGNAPLPSLEQAWVDAAYWFHEGLAEPLDTIAIAKLETSIEVLLSAGSTKGSKARLLTAIKTFYGKGPKDLINQNSQITIEQFVKRIVEDRSRVLHGNWSTLRSYLQDSRPNLTDLTQELLANYALELDIFISSSALLDNIKDFLNNIEDRRTGQSRTEGIKS